MNQPTLTPTLVRFEPPVGKGRSSAGGVTAWEPVPGGVLFTVAFPTPGAPRFPLGSRVPLVLEDEATQTVFRCDARVVERVEGEGSRSFRFALGAAGVPAADPESGPRPPGQGLEIMVASLWTEHALLARVEEVFERGLTLEIPRRDEALLADASELEIVLRLSPQEPLELRARIAARRLQDERVLLALEFLRARGAWETRLRVLAEHLERARQDGAAA